MLTGVALAVRHRGSTAKIVGVEPETADDAARSFSAGVLQRLPGAPSTLADGVRVRAIGERNFEVLVRRRMADAIVTVSESELRAALTEIWRVGRLFVEPTAALPLAAYRAGKIPAGATGSVALVLTGGNIDPSLARQILETS